MALSLLTIRILRSGNQVPGGREEGKSCSLRMTEAAAVPP